MIYGSGLLTPQVQKDADSLLAGRVPMSWEKKWEGPESVQPWIRLLVVKKIALSKWPDKLSQLTKEAFDLSDLFNPGTFLMSLRQQTARVAKLPMDSLALVTSFAGTIEGAPMPINVKGLMLQGAAFEAACLLKAEPINPGLFRCHRAHLRLCARAIPRACAAATSWLHFTFHPRERGFNGADSCRRRYPGRVVTAGVACVLSVE